MPNPDSSVLDERVVEMRIDNRQFVKGAETSISVLDKLKDALNFKNASKDLDDLSAKANRTDFSGMADNIELISKRFTNLGVVGTQVLKRLTDSVYNYIYATSKDLAFGQITAGWAKYEQVTDSIQTIVAATRKYIGEDFEDEADQLAKVNRQIDILTRFTDETSYSLSDMTSNIGKFTSAGVHMENAAVEMQGIASWAGLAGANTQEATRAMYNLSQAIATGSVKLIDWKSIENANMATLEFKEVAIETALALGKLKQDGNGVIRTMKGLEVSAQNFNQTLAEGWFDAETLETVLMKFGDFGDRVSDISLTTGISVSDLLDALDLYHEGTLDFEKWQNELYADMGDDTPTIDALTYAMEILGAEEMALGERAFRASQEVRTFSQALQAVKDKISSGWKDTYTLIFGDSAQQKELWSDVYDMLESIFAKSGERRNQILREWSNLGGRDELIETFYAFADAISSLVAPITQAFEDIFSWGSASEAGEKLYEITKNLKEFMQSLVLSEEASQGLYSIFRSVFSIAKKVLTIGGSAAKVLFRVLGYVGRAVDAILGLFAGEYDTTVFFDNIIGIFEDLSFDIQDAWQYAKDFISTLSDIPIVGTVLNGIVTAVDAIALGFSSAVGFVDVFKDEFGNLKSPMEIFSSIWEAIKRGFTSIGGSEGLFGSLGTAFSSASGFLSNLLTTFLGSTADFRTRVKEFVSEGLRGALDALKELKASDLFEGAKTGTLIYVLIKAADFFTNISKAAKGFADIPKTFVKTLESFNGVLDAYASSQKANTYIKMAAAIAILAAAMWIMADIPEDQFMGIAVTLAFLFLVLSKIAKQINGTKFFSGNSPVILKFGSSLAANLIGLGLLLTAVIVALSKMEKLDWKKTLINSAIIVALIGVILAEVYLIPRDASHGEGKTNWNVFLELIAVAAIIAAIGKALSRVGALSIEQIVVAGVVIGAILLVIMGILDKSKDYKGGKGAFAVIVASIIAIYAVIFAIMQLYALMSFADVETLAKTFSVLVVAVVILAAFMAAVALIGEMKGAMNGVKMLLAVAAGLLLFSISLAISIPAILTFLTGIFALSEALAATGNAGTFYGLLIAITIAIGVIVAVLYVAAPALWSVGAAVLFAGAGVALFGVGLTAAALAIGLMVTTLVPFGKALVEFCDLVAENGEKILTVVSVVILAVVAAIVAAKADIAWGMVAIVVAVLNVLIEKGPEILDICAQLFEMLLEFLYALIPMLVSFIVVGIIYIINGVANSLRSNADALTAAIENLLEAIFEVLIKVLGTLFVDLIQMLLGMCRTLIDAIKGSGYTDALIADLEDKSEQALDAAAKGLRNSFNVGEEAGEQIKTGFSESVADADEVVGDLMTTKMVGGVETANLNVFEAANAGGEGAMFEWMSGVRSAEPDVLTQLDNVSLGMAGTFNMTDAAGAYGNNFVVGFVNGAYGTAEASEGDMRAIASFLSGAFSSQLGIFSPSRVAYGFGEYWDEGFVNGIESGAGDIETSSDAITIKMVDALREAMTQVAMIASDDMSISPVITPVVDMSNVDSSAASIASMFSASGSSIQAAGIGRSMQDLNNLTANMSALSENRANASADTYEINIYPTDGMNPEDIAEAVMLELTGAMTRKGAALG